VERPHGVRGGEAPVGLQTPPRLPVADGTIDGVIYLESGVEAPRFFHFRFRRRPQADFFVSLFFLSFFRRVLPWVAASGRPVP